MTQSPTASPSGEHRSGIGDKGELWLASRLPQGWIWQPPRKDVGKDGLVVIRDDTDLHNLEFSIQVKTTTKARFSRDAIIVGGISRSSVLYWYAGGHPTLIIVVAVSEDRAWYAWHFDAIPSLPVNAGKTVQLRIPLKNTLTPESWDDIRAELKRCYRHLWNSMSKANSFVWLVASIGTVSNAARNLLKISESPVPTRSPTEDQGLLLLMEQQQHRNVLVVASKFLRGLEPTSLLYKEVLSWEHSYEARVRSAFPALGSLATTISNDFRSDLAYHPKHLASLRKDLVFALFDFLALLTRIHPDGSHNAK